MSELPRTLVISDGPFSQGGGFGVTLGTFFREWPRDRLLQLYTGINTTPDRERCTRVEFADVPGPGRRRAGLEFLLARRPAWRGRYSKRWLRRTLRGWRPEVVYALVCSGETLAFAAWAASCLRCPLVTHVADDALERSQAGLPIGPRSLLTASAARLTISEEMRAEYLGRYALDSHVLHNGAADELFTDRSAPASNGHFRVRYLGSIIPGHHFNAIEDVAAAVRTLAEAGVAISFELWGGAWTRQHAERLHDGRHVIYHGEIGKEQGFDLLKSADLLLVPVNFTPTGAEHILLSLPTKLVECLASGTPTLVYGPAGCAPVEFCRRHDVGTFIDERAVDSVVACIRRIAADRSAARCRADRDRTFIRRHHSAHLVAERFQAILRDAAN